MSTRTFQPEARTENELADRLHALETQFAEERRRFRQLYEIEASQRREQFALLLDELSKAVAKLERNDLRLEKDLRREVTRQNRFIYEEFQQSVRRLNDFMESESISLRELNIERSDVESIVRSMIRPGRPDDDCFAP